MRNTRYVQVACPGSGTMVRIMGDHAIPEVCPDCRMPLVSGPRAETAGPVGAEPSNPGGPRIAAARPITTRG
jgi:hypothetical protein